MVTIKGTHDNLELWMDEEAEYTDLKFAIIKKFDANSRFYKGSKLPVAVYGKALSPAQKREIKTMFNERYSISDVNFVDEQLPEIPAPQPTAPVQPTSALSSRITLVAKTGFDEKCIFIDHTLRSGQRVEAQGDVVVLGDVHAGSEIVACGSIAVFGKLVGLAHAGSKGRKDVCIVASIFAPGQIRIASKVAIIGKSTGQPGTQIARITGDKIVVSELNS